MYLLRRNEINIMTTLTTEQLKSELALLKANKINLLFPTKAEVKKYMKVKRNGQSFIVPRADRENVLKQVCEFNMMKRLDKQRRMVTGFDFEGAILDYQEMRDYNC